MIENKRVKARSEVKLLGIIDDKWAFTTHIEDFCSTSNNRLQALAKIRKFIPLKKVIRLSDAYIMSNFMYCLLIWMFCSKTQTILLTRPINVVYLLYGKLRMQTLKIY